MDSPIEDPAAEFLAQEKEALGDIIDEFEITEKPLSAEEPLVEDEEPPKVELPSEDPLVVEDEESLFKSSEPSVKPVPETIKKWREENEKLLEEKDEKEEVMKKELKEQAKKELDDWYKNYNQQLKTTQDNNRGSEKDFIAEVNDITPGTEWERVHKLCDFSTKNNRNSKDMSRMRHILLQLKQTGVKVN
uniref:Clathrin light chain n=1 Tax=Caligus clemensi TaxID=344056 RepID=C1C1L5_CALCM|nr:Clathrin light chain [Caligus clemensi]